MQKEFISDCEAIRTVNPVIHCITNYVAVNFNANALLAVGASPLMSSMEDEFEDLFKINKALYINIGCPDRGFIHACEMAVDYARKGHIPWVLDPVGAGATRLRTGISHRLIDINPPAIIRGNAQEIMTLNGHSFNHSKGVDSSIDSSLALECAGNLARNTGSVVVVSGPTDLITDGKALHTISNGSPLMKKITGAGCTLSALCAAFAAVDDDMLTAGFCATALMGIAGELAASSYQGTGTMQTAILDYLSTFSAEDFAQRIKK